MNKTWQFKNKFQSLLIRGGRVVDPANNFDDAADVLIVDGKIAAVEPNIKSSAEKIFDAAGKIVTPFIFASRGKRPKKIF